MYWWLGHFCLAMHKKQFIQMNTDFYSKNQNAYLNTDAKLNVSNVCALRNQTSIGKLIYVCKNDYRKLTGEIS